MKTNFNTEWATLFVNELINQGIRFACIGAGSRSTPLTLALTQNPSLSCFSHVDERSAGFFSLGIALFTNSPVVLVSTSGTAGANFYPAIIESYYSNVPLIVITADRPQELRGSGANQTINQTDMFGKFVNWFVDLPAPGEMENYQAYLKTVARKSYFYSNYPSPASVHLNFPFRKPLEPFTDETKNINFSVNSSSSISDQGNIIGGRPTLFSTQIKQLSSLFENSSKILLIAGPKTANWVDIGIIADFVEKLNILLFCDGLSSLRFSTELSKVKTRIISSYETFLQITNKLENPDLIIHLGQMPISKYLQEYLKRNNQITRILINDKLRWADSTLQLDYYVYAHPNVVLKELLDNVNSKVSWGNSWISIEKRTWEIIDDYISKSFDFEPTIIAKFFEIIPEASNIFVSNSLPVRHVDQFVNSDFSKNLTLFANRGVSGIDGTISTALGISLASNQETFLITGDLAFYHDMNGLLPMLRYGIPLKIVIINNHGGAIFDRLPIKKFDPPFQEFFLTKHQLTFENIAHQYKIKYLKVTLDNLDRSLQEIHEHDQIIIEYEVSWGLMEEHRNKLMKEITNIFHNEGFK